MVSKLQRQLNKILKAEFRYFAYGSNMSLDQITARCPSARLLGRAQLRGYALAFAGHSQRWGGAVATLLPRKGSTVDGLLFTLRTPCIKALDGWEGHPFVYQRTAVVVSDAQGRKHKALTYMQPLDGFEAWPPSALYLGRIYDAYMANEIDPTPLLRAATPRIFVYGSLMRGFGNHDRLLSGARFVGAAKTRARYTMHSFGAFPGIVQHGRTAISGEIYEVDAQTLEALDRLEGHPRFYCRTLIELADGSHADAYLLRPEQAASLDVIASGNWRKKGHK